MKNGRALRTHALAALLISISAVSAAETKAEMISPSENPYRLGLVENEEAMGFYHYLTDDGMNESYTQAFGMTVGAVGWDKGRSEFRAGSGFVFASGSPLQLNQDWTVVSSSLGTVAIPLSAGYAYRLSDGGEDSLIPYIGITAWWLWGLERISGHVTRERIGGEDIYEWNDTSYRHSFVGYVALGSHKKVSDQFSFVGEIRYAYGGKGRLKRRHLNEEEKEQGWEDVFRDFQHPNYRFSGFSASIGLRW